MEISQRVKVAAYTKRIASQGVLVGFVVSLIVSVWSVVGKLLYPAVMTQLPVVVEFCNASFPNLAVSVVDGSTTVFHAKPVLHTIQPT